MVTPQHDLSKVNYDSIKLRAVVEDSPKIEKKQSVGLDSVLAPSDKRENVSYLPPRSEEGVAPAPAEQPGQQTTSMIATTNAQARLAVDKKTKFDGEGLPISNILRFGELIRGNGYAQPTLSLVQDVVSPRSRSESSYNLSEMIGKRAVAMLSDGAHFGVVALQDGRALTLQIHASPVEAAAWMAEQEEEEKYAKYDAWREKIEGWKTEIKALDEAAKKDKLNPTGERLRNPDGAPPLYGQRSKEMIGGELRKLTVFEWYERHYSEIAKKRVISQVDVDLIDHRWLENLSVSFRNLGRPYAAASGSNFTHISDFFATKSVLNQTEAKRLLGHVDSRRVVRHAMTAARHL